MLYTVEPRYSSASLIVQLVIRPNFSVKFNYCTFVPRFGQLHMVASAQLRQSFHLLHIIHVKIRESTPERKKKKHTWRNVIWHLYGMWVQFQTVTSTSLFVLSIDLRLQLNSVQIKCSWIFLLHVQYCMYYSNFS